MREFHGPDWEPSMDPNFDMYEALVELYGVTESKAKQLADEYANLPTLSWATYHDTEYLEQEVHIKGGFLRKQLRDADLYHSYQFFPERVIRPVDRESGGGEVEIEGLQPRDQRRFSDFLDEDE